MMDIPDPRYRAREKVGEPPREQRRESPAHGDRRNAYRADRTPPGTPTVDLRGLDRVTTGAPPPVVHPPVMEEPSEPPEDVGILRRLREAAYRCNIDADAEIYNEALRYASDGHYRLARERLQILLGMTPDDAGAHVTLARVYAAEERWEEARLELEQADRLGAEADPAFRRLVEQRHQAKRDAEAHQRRAARERDEAELRTLRAEVQRLRADNTEHVAHIAQLQREVRRWAWLTAAVSMLAIGFIAVTFTVSGEPTREPANVDRSMPTFHPPERTAPATTPTLGAVTPAPSSSEALLLARVDAVLSADPSTRRLAATVQGTEVTLSGAVRAAADLQQAVDALELLGASVHDEAVSVAALEFGTTHDVQPGDELIPLAIHYYGTKKFWTTIQADNDLERKPLRAGTTINIPPIHPSAR